MLESGSPKPGRGVKHLVPGLIEVPDTSLRTPRYETPRYDPSLRGATGPRALRRILEAQALEDADGEGPQDGHDPAPLPGHVDHPLTSLEGPVDLPSRDVH